jgi:hypothetical protein
MKSYPVAVCPSFIREFADHFKDLLPRTEYRCFVASLCGAVFGLSGLSDIFRYFMFSPSVSSLGRFFGCAGDVGPSLEKLNRRHRRYLKQKLLKVEQDPNRYLWVIDDTLVPRTGRGKKTWGSYWWHDHGSSGNIFGHKLMVLGLVDRQKKAFHPLFWDVLHRSEDKDAEEYEKGWEVALRLLESALNEGLPRCTVVFDSWFAGDEFFSKLIALKVDFVSEIRCNRRIVGYSRQAGLYDRVDCFFASMPKTNVFYRSRRSWASEANLWFNDASMKLKTVAVSNKKTLDEKAFAYYVSNKLTWNASKIWGISRCRWSIEVSFRDLKQFFTLGEAAVRNQSAVEMSIALAMFALSVVRSQQYAGSDANEHQYVQLIPAGDIVRNTALTSFTGVISKLVRNDASATTLKTKISLRIHLKNLRQKPTESDQQTTSHVAQRIQADAA